MALRLARAKLQRIYYMRIYHLVRIYQRKERTRKRKATASVSCGGPGVVGALGTGSRGTCMHAVGEANSGCDKCSGSS